MLLVLFFFISCTTPQYTWTHSDHYYHSEGNFRRDEAQCNMYAQNEYLRIASPNNVWASLGGMKAKENAYENCMYSRGWYKEQK